MHETIGTYVYGDWSGVTGPLTPQMGSGQFAHDSLRSILGNVLSRSGRTPVLTGGSRNEQEQWTEQVTAVPPFSSAEEALNAGRQVSAAWQDFITQTSISDLVKEHSDTFTSIHES